jgi:hypothetical protein
MVDAALAPTSSSCYPEGNSLPRPPTGRVSKANWAGKKTSFGTPAAVLPDLSATTVARQGRNGSKSTVYRFLRMFRRSGSITTRCPVRERLCTICRRL